MATSLNVNGKLVKRPGVYAYILSGIQNPPLNLSYGNVCIIDDGIGANFGGGSGVNGELKQGKDSIYNFTDIQSFQSFVKGGELWNLAQPLFKPILNNPQINGISKLTFIRACTTTAATTTFTLTNGNIVFKHRDEGLNANGALTSGNLTAGYGSKIIASPATPGEYRLQIWHSTFKGTDSLNNAPYDNISAALSKPTLVIESPDVRTIGELASWMQTDKTFNQGFLYVSDNIPSTTTTTTTTSTSTTTTSHGALTTTTTTTTPLGIIVSGDITSGYILASGGTESYGSTDFDDALNAVKDADNTFFLAMQYGDGTIGDGTDSCTGVNNTKIFNFVTSGDSKFEKFLIVGAGYDKADYITTSYNAVQYYNNDHVIVVHGGGKKTSRLIGGFTLYHQLYKAANVLGRTCGLEPQVPSTLKSLDFDGEVHVLDDNEIDYALDFGILVSYMDDDLGYDVILQDINSLQNNQYLINEDGTSFSIQVRRITAQLNKEIIVDGKKRFYGNATTGGNRNTISPAEVSKWLEGKLKSRTASDKKDDLILGYRNIVITVNQDNTTCTYEFAINGEVNKLLFIGTIVNF